MISFRGFPFFFFFSLCHLVLPTQPFITSHCILSSIMYTSSSHESHPGTESSALGSQVCVCETLVWRREELEARKAVGIERATDLWERNLAHRPSPPQQQERGVLGVAGPGAWYPETGPTGEARAILAIVLGRAKAKPWFLFSKSAKAGGYQRREKMKWKDRKDMMRSSSGLKAKS